MPEQGVAPAPRSTFVTVVACFLIAAAGFSTVIGMLQFVFFGVLFHVGGLDRAMDEKAPAAMVFFFENFLSFTVIFTVLSAALFVAALGLILRKEWGRLCTRAMLVIAALGGLAAAALQVVLTTGVWAGAPAPALLEFFSYVTIAGHVVGSLLFVAIVAWLVLRLGSPEVRREFGVA